MSGVQKVAVGTVLGRLYRVTRHIGQGAQGDVYEVEHVRLGTRFAAKLLLPYLAADPASISRFEREASTASQLAHPNIARVVNFDQLDDGRYFAIMELLDGEDLQTVLERGPLPVRPACRLILDVASALAAAHDAGVVHRDLKPSNLFLAETPHGKVVKLTDFGISKVVETDDTKLTSTGAVVGTPMYMSPEQASGEAIDARTDVYAAGVVLFEMFAGRPPFSARKSHQLIVEKTLMDPPDPHRLLPTLPRGIADVVRRCLAKKKGDRFVDMRAFAAALETALEVAGIDDSFVIDRFDAPTTVVSFDTLATRDRSSSIAPFLAGGLLVGALVGVGTYFAVVRDTPPAEAHVAPVPVPAPPPPAPAAPRPVHLETVPTGALVRDVDGNEIGRTPLDLDVDAAARYSLSTGDGRRAGVDLAPEQAGETVTIHLPPPETKKKIRKRRRRKRKKKNTGPAPIDVVIE